MLRSIVLSLIFILALIFMVSCSGGDGNVITPTPASEDRTPVSEPASGNTTCLGLWQVTIDKDAGTIEAVDMRSSNLILNVLGFLEPPAMSGMTIDFTTLVLADPIVEVDVILTHPIPDPVFMGFDVRGVVFGPEVSNADGLTVIPSPEYFDGVPFGYQDGLLGAPENYVHYKGLAGYKYFCDGLTKDADLVAFMSNPANLAKRGVFSPKPQKNTRHYVLDWSGGSLGFMVFNYAIYANYNWPTGSAPIDISDFDITTANSAEAFCAKVTETANTLWYSGVSGGGKISLDIEVWDWQGNISNVTIESVTPGIMAQTSYSSKAAGSTAYSYVDSFFDVFATPIAVGNLDLLVTATDSKTFGGAWFLGLLPSTHPMYNKKVYNCWIYGTNVIECPPPKPTSVIPGSHDPDNILFAATINGTNFINGSSLDVKLKKTGQPDIPTTNVSYVSGTQIKCDITIPLNTALGFWDVEVVNGCSVVGTGIGLFEVVCPPVTVSGINPNTHDANGVGFLATITGSGFVAGSSLAVALTRTGYSDINATSPVVTSPTQMTCNFTIPVGTTLGQWNVRVTNGCGKVGTGNNLLTVTCPTPIVTSINPGGHRPDGIAFPATITGNYFTAGPSLAVTLTKTGQPDIKATSPVVVSPTQITCTLTIPITAAYGAWNVQVTNGCGGTAGVGYNLFSVNICGSYGAITSASQIYCQYHNTREGIALTRLGSPSYAIGRNNSTNTILLAYPANSGTSMGTATHSMDITPQSQIRDLVSDSQNRLYMVTTSTTAPDLSMLRWIQYTVGTGFGKLIDFGQITPKWEIWRITVDPKDNPVVLGISGTTLMSVFHWNGASWTEIKVPAALFGTTVSNINDFDYNPYSGHYVFVYKDPSTGYTDLRVMDSAGTWIYTDKDIFNYDHTYAWNPGIYIDQEKPDCHFAVWGGYPVGNTTPRPCILYDGLYNKICQGNGTPINNYGMWGTRGAWAPGTNRLITGGVNGNVFISHYFILPPEW